MNQERRSKNYELNIGWLYPELMSTYGDRGNIMVFEKRCLWRGIHVKIIPIDFTTKIQDLQTMNLIFGGGAQDRQQGILIEDLRKMKGPTIKAIIESGVPGLFVCGSPQLLGHFYTDADGKKLDGLGIFDMTSIHPGKDTKRCIGNLVASLDSQFSKFDFSRNTIVGFENHGGRTYLGKGVTPFAHVLFGNGNNGEDGTEGAVYKNCIATYSHGPFLPKNPHIADYLIAKALEVKYGKRINLTPLDDTLEWTAHDEMVRRVTSK